MEVSKLNIKLDFFSGISLPVLLTDHELQIKWANQAFWELSRIPKSEQHDASFYFNGPLSKPEELNSLMHRCKNNEYFYVKLLNYTYDGYPYYLEIEAQPVNSDSGEPHYILMISRDISREMVTKKRKDLLESLLNATNNAVAVLELHAENIDFSQLKFVDVNSAFSHITGFSKKEVITQAIELLFGPKTEQRKVDLISKRLADGRTANMELVMYRKEGSFLWSRITVNPVLDSDNEQTHWILVLQDITAQKEGEMELRLLHSVVQHAKDPVIITKAEPLGQEQNGPEIIYVNPAFTEMTGYEPEEVIGKTPRIQQGPRSNRKELDRIRKALEQWETVESELINYRKDGSEYWVNFVITPIADETGWYTHWVSIQRDVTLKKEEEFQMLTARRQAEAASKAKSEFLSTMSHEIRTPLNAIIGMTGLLADTPLDDEQLGFVKTIRNGGESLLSVINDILDYSKIEAGKMELESFEFAVLEPIEDALDLASNHAFKKGLELLYYAEDDIPEVVTGDVTRIRQIILNLVNNAIKFTEEGEILVRVSLLRKLDNWCELEFSVKDTGIGIPKEKLDRLFNSFSQVDASTTRKYGGTGLGLAICRKLTELHGGRIWVESEEGKGSTFFFTIQTELSDSKVMDANDTQELKGKKILILDDNQTNLIILEKQLKRVGIEVDACIFPTQALDLLSRNSAYDLIISDFHMPEMDGVDFGGKIRINPDLAHIPLLLLSSGAYNHTLEQKEIFNHILQKPTRQGDLYKVINRLINKISVEENSKLKESQEIPGFEDLQILLVEDNTVNQRVALKMLEKLGNQAALAFNGKEALDMVKQFRYDLVLMDMQMPVMDGIEATHCIRRLSQITQPRILAMTANASEQDRRRCLEAGMDDFISKPIRFGELREFMVNWLVKLQIHDISHYK